MLLDRVAGQHQPSTFQNSLNSVTDADFEDYAPPAGVKDIKGAKLPTEFNGKVDDARPFIERIETYFALVPNAYRLTQRRILFTCSLINTYPADSWAAAVARAVRELDDNDYYTDNWENFITTFIQNFGIIDEKEDALNKISQLVQGTMELQTYNAEFRRLQVMAELPDDVAMRQYKRGLRPFLRNLVASMWPAPKTLKTWIEMAVARDHQMKEVREFNAQNKVATSTPAPRNPPASQQRHAHPPVRFQQRPARDPDAMDVDALGQRIRRPATLQTSSSSSGTHPQGPRPPTNADAKGKQPIRPNMKCHRCGQEGHFMRSCRVAVNQIDEQHINALISQALSLKISEDSSPPPDAADIEYDAEAINFQDELLEEAGDDEEDF